MRGVYALVLALGLSACGGAATPQPTTAAGDGAPIAWYPALSSETVAADIEPEHVELAKRALEQGPAGAAAQQLRQLGTPGLDALLAADDGSEQARAVIEAVARQRDARHSRLYWHTDLEAAKLEAELTQRPILSLRLLGRLDQELSCANSRFFRTALYANRRVSAYLRNHFVLHWKSERPAPRVTVDFGDGRRLERTLTGNSIHYVLDAQGRVVDALPGLYGPQAFMGLLGHAERVAQQLHAVGPEPMRAAILNGHHRQRVTAIGLAWSADLMALGLAVEMPEPRQIEQPSAVDAMPNAFPKMAVEGPTLAAITPPSGQQLEGLTDEGLWRRIAARRVDMAQLDAASLVLMKDKSPARLLPGGRLETLDEAGLRRLAASFEQSMALDTVRNEYLLHRKIHQWLERQAIADMEALNSRVYAELFLTPASDPWMGLVSNNVYTAIERDGLSETPNERYR